MFCACCVRWTYTDTTLELGYVHTRRDGLGAVGHSRKRRQRRLPIVRNDLYCVLNRSNLAGSIELPETPRSSEGQGLALVRGDRAIRSTVGRSRARDVPAPGTKNVILSLGSSLSSVDGGRETRLLLVALLLVGWLDTGLDIPPSPAPTRPSPRDRARPNPLGRCRRLQSNSTATSSNRPPKVALDRPGQGSPPALLFCCP